MLVDGFARNYRNPDGSAPAWAEYEIKNLYHSATLEANPDNSFGDDYIAGGAAHDVIFGQLGNDTIQGDGSIEGELGGNPVLAHRAPDNSLVLMASFEAATDGDDYIEGNGGNDIVFGGLGQDDMVGGSSDLFTLDLYTERPDGVGHDLRRRGSRERTGSPTSPGPTRSSPSGTAATRTRSSATTATSSAWSASTGPTAPPGGSGSSTGS